jgi:hypothetical protein
VAEAEDDLRQGRLAPEIPLKIPLNIAPEIRPIGWGSAGGKWSQLSGLNRRPAHYE